MKTLIVGAINLGTGLALVSLYSVIGVAAIIAWSRKEAKDGYYHDEI